MTAPNAKRVCKHSRLYLDVSPHASKAGFKRPTERQRTLAATKDGRVGKRLELLTSKELFGDGTAFPGPLILPDDDLAEDPEHPPQDFREWRDEEERNPVTQERKAIYIVASPSIGQEVSKMKAWSICNAGDASKQQEAAIKSPDIKDIMEYVSAFFHGMDVKLFEEPFHWQKWDNKYDGTVLKTANANRRIGLRTPMQELFGIRCRASPDGVSPMQVNLDDLLDALAENIPPDAHSVMMLLDQDMYEGDGDVFCAGRAYGGSRIAAVSLFRDQPSCAPRDDGHGWPSSHCAAYVDGLCLDGSKPPAKKAKLPPMRHQESGGPLRAAVEAATIRLERGIPPEAPTAQWLARVVVTTTHELCHCLGLDHCVYFACAMQGCGSVEEAQRQPPYACPVCLEKIAATIGEGLVDGWDDEAMGKSVRERYVKERYEALRRVCEKWGDSNLSRMFAGYKAWLDAVIEQSC